MEKAICKSVEYVPGERHLFQGVSSYIEDAPGFRNRGHGWGETFTSSKLILKVEIECQEQEIWVDRFFKTHIGRMTAKRRNIIELTMPECVSVELVDNGWTTYYVVNQSDLNSWLNQVRSQL